MPTPPAFQFYARDWFTSTRALGAFGRGIFIDMLCLEWDNGPLDDDPEIIAYSVGADVEQVRKLWPRLREKFVEAGPGKIINRRLEAVRADQAARRRERAEAGRAGAASKWGSPNEGKGKRSERLAEARSRGVHRPEEWMALLAACGSRCCRCGSPSEIVKDHILPIYAGGSDAVENLQPLCRRCNSAKGQERVDHRPAGWRERLATLLATPGVLPGVSQAKDAWQHGVGDGVGDGVAVSPDARARVGGLAGALRDAWHHPPDGAKRWFPMNTGRGFDALADALAPVFAQEPEGREPIEFAYELLGHALAVVALWEPSGGAPALTPQALAQEKWVARALEARDGRLDHVGPPRRERPGATDDVRHGQAPIQRRSPQYERR